LKTWGLDIVCGLKTWGLDLFRGREGSVDSQKWSLQSGNRIQTGEILSGRNRTGISRLEGSILRKLTLDDGSRENEQEHDTEDGCSFEEVIFTSLTN
jgi:hypothetical protein